MRRPLGPQEFAELVPVSRETLARLEAYAELLTRWSSRDQTSSAADTLPRPVAPPHSQFGAARSFRSRPGAQSLDRPRQRRRTCGPRARDTRGSGVELVEAEFAESPTFPARGGSHNRCRQSRFAPCRIPGSIAPPPSTSSPRAPARRSTDLLDLAEAFLDTRYPFACFQKARRFNEGIDPGS